MFSNRFQFLIAGLLVFGGGIMAGSQIFEAGFDSLAAVGGYSVKSTSAVSPSVPTSDVSGVVPNTNSSSPTTARVDVLNKVPVQGGPSHFALFNGNGPSPSNAFLIHEGGNSMQNVSFDISSPHAPTSVPFVVGAGNLNLAPRPRSIAVNGDYIYTVNDQTHMLSVYRLYNTVTPTPVLIGPSQALGVPTGRYPRAVAASGNYVYVANYGDSTVQIFDVATPENTRLVGSVSLEAGSGLVSIAVSGNYAYVTKQMTNSLQIIDVTNKAAPVLRGSVAIEAGAFPYDAIVSGNYAYIAGTAKSLIKVVDVSNPSSPSVVGSLYTGPNSTPSTLAISGRYLYVGNALPGTVDVIDVANPTAPKRLTSVSVGASGVSAIAASGEYIFIAGRAATSNFFQIAKLSFVAEQNNR